MEIQRVTETPAPVQRIDYEELASHYNDLDVDETLKMPSVYNTTLFKKTLERKGLGADDVEVYQRKGNCYITRKSTATMV